MRGRLFSIGRQYEEAAADLGASPAQALRLVLFPLLVPAIVAGAAITFAISIDDFVISQYLSCGAGCDHCSDLIYSSTRGAPRPTTNAIASIMVVFTRSRWRSATSSTASSPAARRARRRHDRGYGGVRVVSDNPVGWRAMAGEIDIIELVKQFGDVAAVDGIDLDMPSGEFFSMLGPSGCGKTTTLRMIAGFEQPTEGRILLDGDDMQFTPPHKRQREHGVPELRAVSAPERVATTSRSACAARRSPKAELAHAGRRGARAGPADRLREAQAGPDVGRPAAARGARPGAGAEAGRAAPGRAAGRAGRQAPQAAAGGAEGAPAAGRDHIRLRDPRPGGGARRCPTGSPSCRTARSSRSGRRRRSTRSRTTTFVADFLGVSNLMDAEAQGETARATPGSRSASSSSAPPRGTSMREVPPGSRSVPSGCDSRTRARTARTGSPGWSSGPSIWATVCR